MTREELIRMAREAGLVGGPVYAKGLEAFAALVRADERDRAMRENAYVLAEREACAKVCENLPMQQDVDVRDQAAAAIRARGNT